MRPPGCQQWFRVIEIIVAGRNRDKVEEIRRQLQGVAHVHHAPSDISPEFEEGSGTSGDERGDGPTASDPLERIARAKAAAWSRAMPRSAAGAMPLVVATDGGLLIPGLGPAWDPVRTRRFTGERTSRRERVGKLLSLAGQLHGDDRRIGWREALAVAHDGEVRQSWVAESPPGLLASTVPTTMDGNDSFWVPLIWCCPEFGGKRLAALSSEERQAREDHWTVLGRQLREWMAQHPGCVVGC